MCYQMKPIQLPTHKTFWNIPNSSKGVPAHRARAPSLGSGQIPSGRAKEGGDQGPTEQPMLLGTTLLTVGGTSQRGRKNSAGRILA